MPTPKRISIFVTLPVLLLLSGLAWSLDSQWYIGLGGGQSFLTPEPLNDGIEQVEDSDAVTASSFILGRDVGELASLQIQLWSLGETELTNNSTITYTTVENSLLYRFYDTRDRQLLRTNLALALYGKLSLGYIDRDTSSELALDTDGEIYFGGGLGAEAFIWGPLSLRLEYTYLDRDVQTASLSTVFRFGGAVGSARPSSQSTQTAVPTADNNVPSDSSTDAQADAFGVNQPSAIDSDADGVADDLDKCPASRPGYPVRSSGCGLLSGVFSGIAFIDRSADLEAGSEAQLNNLANLLTQFPEVRVQLLAYTDSRGDRVEQANITRNRLRTIGNYLVGKGISARRLTLRSMGAERPRYDNSTEAGRIANNRIELLEGP